MSLETIALICMLLGCAIAIPLAIAEKKRTKRYGKSMSQEQFKRIMSSDPYPIIKTKILDSAHVITTQKKAGSTIARAAVGGVIAGDAGALIGASTAKKQVKEKHTTTFLVYYEGGTVVTKTVDNNSSEYHKLIDKLEI